MSNNIRRSLVHLEAPIDPNFESDSITTNKIYPVTSIIGPAQNGSGGYINGNLEFQYTVPFGFRQDVSKSYIMFDITCGTGANPPIHTTTTSIAPNVCSTFFTTGRLELNDYLVSSSNNVPQDDTLMKRLMNSYTKNTSINSAGYVADSDTNRFNAWQTYLRQTLAWFPDCLMNKDMVVPENTKVHLILASNPNLQTAANSPAFVAQTDAAGDGLVYFWNIYMINTFIRVKTPIPREVFIPAYTIKSTYQNVSGTSNNFQFTIPKETYKIAVVLQSNAATTRAGQAVTKFSSGGGIAAAQNAFSLFLTTLQLRYAGQSYPSTQYNLVESATQEGSADAYIDFLSNTDGCMDPSGAESITQWSDSRLIGDVGQGRVLLFSIVKSSKDMDSNAELTLTFSTAPTTTRCILFSISKSAIGIKYNEAKQVQEIAAIPFS